MDSMRCSTRHTILMNVIKLLPIIIQAAPLYAYSSTSDAPLESSFANGMIATSMDVQNDGGDTDESTEPSKRLDALHRRVAMGQDSLLHQNIFDSMTHSSTEMEGHNLRHASRSSKLDNHQVSTLSDSMLHLLFNLFLIHVSMLNIMLVDSKAINLGKKVQWP